MTITHMKRTIAISGFALLITAAFLRDAVSQPNLVRQIAPGVYYRVAEPEKRIIANTGWVVFRDYVLVIDANYPWGARAILADLRKTTDKPIRFVFDTHYHADHSFGNGVFVDAGSTILCSEECTAEAKAKNPKAWNGDKGTGDFSLGNYRLEHPQFSFQGKMVIDDGEHRVELVRVGPGHTLGDSVAWLPKERILFTGDLCVNQAGNNMADPDANPDGWLRALDNLALKDVQILIPGHGAQGGIEMIRSQRAYIAAMIEGVRTGIQKRQSAADLERSLDLTGYKPQGADAKKNAPSIRAVYAKLAQK